MAMQAEAAIPDDKPTSRELEATISEKSSAGFERNKRITTTDETQSGLILATHPKNGITIQWDNTNQAMTYTWPEARRFFMNLNNL